MKHTLKTHLLISHLILFALLPGNSWAQESSTIKNATNIEANKTSSVSTKGRISFTGVYGELLTNVEKHVRLVKRLRDKKGPALLDGERRRLESRVPLEIKQALEPFGYYQVSVQQHITAATDNKTVTKYRYDITLNQVVTVANIDLRLDQDALLQNEFKQWITEYPLKKGMPLNQTQYDNSKKQLISNAIRLGYFDSKYTKSAIEINEERTLASIILHFNSGKRYSVSDVTVNWDTEGLDDEKNKRGIDPDILSSLLNVEVGQYYSADDLAKTQRSLLTTPYFSSVDVRTGDRDQNKSTVPIMVNLTPNKRKAYNFAIGAGSDTGIRASVGYENRRINRQGHNINTRFGGSDIQKTAIINYRIPLSRSSKDSLNFYSSLEEETGDSRRFQAAKIGSEWTRAWNDSTVKFGLVASREKFDRQDDNSILDNSLETQREIDLITPTFYWERTKSNDLYFPTKGWSANVLLRAASQSVGSDIDLSQAIFNGKILQPFGLGRLKLRLTLAGSIIDEATALPESLGFLAGGDDSIRGYSYESVGVERNGDVTVGKNLIVGSFEYEHPVRKGFALAGFIDIGDAFDNNADYKRGAGVGLRWRLPFGALRLDAASALDLEGQPFRLHFSFGTDL